MVHHVSHMVQGNGIEGFIQAQLEEGGMYMHGRMGTSDKSPRTQTPRSLKNLVYLQKLRSSQEWRNNMEDSLNRGNPNIVVRITGTPKKYP